MPIQIPFHSQASPGVVPNAGARAMPGGFGSLQQAARMPLNDQRATADMFSGGLQGLQSVGNLLGNVGSGLFEIASNLRKQDDNNIRSEAATGYQLMTNEMNRELDGADPSDYLSIFRAHADAYRSDIMERDMPDSVRQELLQSTAMNLARARGSIDTRIAAGVRDKSVVNMSIEADQLEKNFDIPGLEALYERRVEDKTLTPWDGAKGLLISKEKARRYGVRDQLAVPQPWNVELKNSPYITDRDEMDWAKGEQHRQSNNVRAEWQDSMTANPDAYSPIMIEKAVEDTIIDRKFADTLLEARRTPPTPEFIAQTIAGVTSYDSTTDKDGTNALNLKKALAVWSQDDPVAAQHYRSQLTKSASWSAEPVKDKKTQVLADLKKDILTEIGGNAETDLISDHPDASRIYNAAATELNNLLRDHPEMDQYTLKTKARKAVNDAVTPEQDPLLKKSITPTPKVFTPEDAFGVPATDPELPLDDGSEISNGLLGGDPEPTSASRSIEDAGGSAGVVEYKQSSVAGTRKGDLTPKLKNVLEGASATSGYKIVVTSGGQPAPGGGKRVGSRRHDHGYAADVEVWKDGKRLSAESKDPDDIRELKAFAMAAKEAGATAIGAGPGYQNGKFHIDISRGQPGVGGAAFWGANGSRLNAPKWLREVMQ